MITLNRAWEDYYEEQVSKGIVSVKSEKSRYDKHVRDYLGSFALDNIKKRDLVRFKTRLEDMYGLQKPSSAHVIRLIGRIYQKALDDDLYEGKNPRTGIKLIKSKRIRKRFLSIQKADALIRRLKEIDPTTYRQAAFALYSGLRLNEVLQLCKDRILLERSLIRVMTKSSGEEDVEDFAIIGEELESVISDILSEKHWKGNELFFPKPFSYTNYYKAVDSLKLNEGYTNKDRVNWISFHSLRHAYGSHLAESGASLPTIQEAMRHSDQASTLIYLKSSRGQTKQASKNLAKYREEQLWKNTKKN